MQQGLELRTVACSGGEGVLQVALEFSLIVAGVEIDRDGTNMLALAVNLSNQIHKFENLIKTAATAVRKKKSGAPSQAATRRGRPPTQGSGVGERFKHSPSGASSLVSVVDMVCLLDGIDEAVASSLGQHYNRSQDLNPQIARLHKFILEKTEECLKQLRLQGQDALPADTLISAVNGRLTDLRLSFMRV